VKRASAQRGGHSIAGPAFSSYVMSVKNKLINAASAMGRIAPPFADPALLKSDSDVEQLLLVLSKGRRYTALAARS
jgi:hypothetical protein